MQGGRSLPREIFEVITGYVKGQLLIWLITTVLYLVGFGAIRAPAWFLIAIVLPLVDWIPHFGPVIGLGFALFVTWVGGGDFNRVLLAGGVWLIVETVSSYILQPRILGRKLGLSPLTVFAVTIVGGFAFGPLGLILAVPVAAVVAILWRRFGPAKAEIRKSR
jgi:predicted PurR-regulated permease PerM